MLSLIKKYLNKINRVLLLEKSEIYRNYSYSQCGEDIIINRILKRLNVLKLTYLDIGTNYPIKLNNTYKFYENGNTGVLIEPDPFFVNEIKKIRKKDIVLNIGVGIDNSDFSDLYIMSNKYLNTFSKSDAEKISSYGKNKIERIIKIPLININNIIKNNFEDCPNLISLDVEGLDFEILKTFNFKKYRPEVFCIETITYTENNKEQKNNEIINFMISNGYILYGDTYINSIFVDKRKWYDR